METVIVLVERNHSQKDTETIQDFLESFEQVPFPIYIYESPAKKALKRFNRRRFKTPWIQSLYKVSWALSHIHIWPALLLRNDIGFKTWHLTNTLKKAPYANKDIILFGRSQGGLIATKTALKHPIHKIICSGYPFKPPQQSKEAPYRFAHLDKLMTPTLILQGTQDEYGGKDTLPNYPLSSAISVVFFETNHDFKLTLQDKEKLNRVIKTFLQKP